MLNKFTISIAIAIMAYIGGWKTNGWRLEAKQKDALVQAIDEHKKQSAKDAEAANKVLLARVTSHKKTSKLLSEARRAKFSCRFNSSTFVRLYNNSAKD